MEKITNQNFIFMNKSKLYEIIKIVCTAIISVAATLLANSCAVSTNIQKNNSGSSINSEATQQTKTDSLTFKIY